MLSIITLIIEFVSLHIVKIMGIERINNTLASSMIFVFSIAFAVSVQNNEKLKKYSTQILAGYLCRILIVYFDLFGNNIRTLPHSGADGMMFYGAAERWALYGIESERGFFVYVMWKLFDFIGVNRLYAQFLLMLLSIASLVLYVLIIDELVFDDETKEKAALMLATS